MKREMGSPAGLVPQVEMEIDITKYEHIESGGRRARLFGELAQLQNANLLSACHWLMIFRTDGLIRS